MVDITRPVIKIYSFDLPCIHAKLHLQTKRSWYSGRGFTAVNTVIGSIPVDHPERLKW